MKNTPIKENHLYQKAYKKGRSAVAKTIAVYVLPDRQNVRFVKADPCHRPLNRLGLTTGKKIGGATVRSRARRTRSSSATSSSSPPAQGSRTQRCRTSERICFIA